MRSGLDATFVLMYELDLDRSVISGEVTDRLALWILPGHMKGVTMSLDENGIYRLKRQFELCEIGERVIRSLATN